MTPPKKGKESKVIKGVASPSIKQVEHRNDAMRRLADACEENIEVLIKKKMSYDVDQQFDYARSSLRIISLMEELAKLSDENPAVPQNMRAEFRSLQRRIVQCISSPEQAETKPLPNVAPELWDKRANKSEVIVEFLLRVYGDWITSEQMALFNLRQLDFKAYKAFYTWRSSGNTIPNELKLSTKKDFNSKKLADMGLLLEHPDDKAIDTIKLMQAYETRLRGRKPRPD